MAITCNARRRLAAAAARILLFSLAVVAQAAQAIEMESLYTVEVELSRNAPDPQAQAYADALKAVLVRVTGDEAAGENEDLLGLFPNPARYVLQFLTGEDRTLVVSLDGPAIEALLRRAGHPVWDSDRPLTLVWVAVDRGLGDREIVAADEEGAGSRRARLDRNRGIREQMLDAAERRGIPLVFPLVDAEDLESISFSDIWGGFDQALLDASRRYGTSSILVGRIRSEELFQNRWTYYYGSQQLSWTGGPETAVNLLADSLAEQFAYAGNAPVENVTLTISGIESVSGYGAVQRLLSGLSAIESYKIDTVAGSEIRYTVRIQGGTDRLASALEFSGLLRRPDWLGVDDLFAEEGSSYSLAYEYRPVENPRPMPDGAGEAETPDTESF